jgi:hypothetical protein
MQNPIRNSERIIGKPHRAVLTAMLAISAFAMLTAAINAAAASTHLDPAPQDQTPSIPSSAQPHAGAPLLVIGFMGGRVHGDNLAHGEARLARDLDRRYAGAVDAITFANRDARQALRTVLEMLDTSNDGRLSESEKGAARIVLFGHSWGASEAIHFARELNSRGIPVLLTIQVDSVEKSGQDDRAIPPNVREAVNFYQTHGLFHGRKSIQAIDPHRTHILGNYQSDYKGNPVSCAGYSWYARAFMHSHIEIENDDAVWGKIEKLIVARSGATTTAAALAQK